MFKCPKCHRGQFVSKEELAAHVYRYHRKTPLRGVQYQCSACKRSYMRLNTLKKHQQICIISVSPQRHEALPAESIEEDPSAPSSDDNDADNNPLQEPEVDVSSARESTENTAEERLQDEVVKFLLHLKDDCNATQHLINEVIDGLTGIQQRCLEILESRFVEQAKFVEVLSVEDILGLVKDMKESSVFQGVETKSQLEDFLLENKGLVKPQKVILSTRQELRKNQLITRHYFGHIIPFLPQLQSILECKDVLHCVDNPRASQERRFRTVLDGHYYHQHPVYKKDNKALAIILYLDGVELVDPLSSRTGKHNLTQFYWTLGNIYPEFRSSDRVINLLATVETSLLKEHGYKKILEDFIKGMIQLSSDAGVTFTINDEERVFHGLLLCVCGDYPALASIGGFKESVTAGKPCRECMAPKESYLKTPNISTFQKRDMETHLIQLEEIEAFGCSTYRKQGHQLQDPSIRYGVNCRSELLKVPHFDVTKCLVQDIMHIGTEGTEELLCRVLLKHVIYEQKSMSLSVVNKSIQELSKTLQTDKPSIITEDHIKKKLRQSSAQTRNLALILPFVLRIKGSDGTQNFAGERKYLDCYVAHLRMMNYAMCYEFRTKDVKHFTALIQQFHEKLLTIIPDFRMAKVHFWHHCPEEIRLFGVLRQLACFGFERHHAFFKRITRIIRNFKNITLSLATRHQTRQCNYMSHKNFLYKGHTYSTKRELPADTSDLHINIIKSIATCNETIEEAGFLEMNGTTFKPNAITPGSNSPQNISFLMIQKIYVLDKRAYFFICQKLLTKEFCRDLNAYEVELQPSKVAIDAETLPFKHEVRTIRYEGRMFVIPLGHNRLLQ